MAKIESILSSKGGSLAHYMMTGKTKPSSHSSDKLNKEQFTFTTTKDGKVMISFDGREVTTVVGNRARRFMDHCETASLREIQLMLAKLTGNFKRENE